jgi:4-carboxymuconolactone decarboxylase
MAEIMGPAYLERREELRNEFNSPVQDYSEEVCFGRIWVREGIDRKQRSIISAARLTGLNCQAQSRTHLEGAPNNGCSSARSVKSCCRQAVYCGLPAAVDVFHVADGVLKARELLE